MPAKVAEGVGFLRGSEEGLAGEDSSGGSRVCAEAESAVTSSAVAEGVTSNEGLGGGEWGPLSQTTSPAPTEVAETAAANEPST